MPFVKVELIWQTGENSTYDIKSETAMMRCVLLTGLAAAGVIFGTTFVGASTRSTAPIDEATRDYWRAAQRLTQDQARLLDRVERAAKTPEANRLKTLNGQIFLHTSAVDRFLKTNYSEPALLCSPPSGLGQVAGTDGATLEQVQVYCSLHRSTRDFMTMRWRLDQQAKLLTAPVSTVEVKPTQNRRTTRKSIYQPPINRQAIITASSREVLILVEASRRRLAQMQPSFPEAMRTSIAPSLPALPRQSADSRSH